MALSSTEQFQWYPESVPVSATHSHGMRAQGNTALTERLLKAGATADLVGPVAAEVDGRRTDFNGGTALLRAAYAGHCVVVRLLLTRKARVNAPDNEQLTPLHCAAMAGHTEVLEVLIAAGADPCLRVRFLINLIVRVLQALENIWRYSCVIHASYGWGNSSQSAWVSKGL